VTVVGALLPEVLVAVLLFTMVGAAALSTLGVLTARDTFDRLHYVGPASMLGGVAVVAATVAETGFSMVALRAAVAVGVLQVAAAVSTHATARAALGRGELGRLRDADDQVVEP
jgi:multisubunit Na+/H+ antiporter MnhG subunit